MTEQHYIEDILPDETISLYEALAKEYLQDLYTEFLTETGMDTNILDINITVKTNIKLKEEIR